MPSASAARAAMSVPPAEASVSDQLRGPREADLAHGALVERAGQERVHVRGLVGAEDGRERRGLGLHELVRVHQTALDEARAQLGVLAHGEAVARRAKGFNMRVLYYQRTRRAPEEEARLGVEYRSMHDLLLEADFVSLHTPLTPETRYMLGAAELALMKPTAYLINTGRGPVVDEAALVRALKEGKLAGAGLDVYEHEPQLTPGLAELPNVVLAPHIGSATRETRANMSVMAAGDLLAGLRGERPQNPVNPEVLERR
jgi:hypothetical protein